jgi:hypothetical protein
MSVLHKFKFIGGTGMSLSESENTTTGQDEITFTNSAPSPSVLTVVSHNQAPGLTGGAAESTPANPEYYVEVSIPGVAGTFWVPAYKLNPG